MKSHPNLPEPEGEPRVGGIVEWLLGVEAAGRPLEAVARPITAVRARVAHARG
jgi:hypothetical protein